MSNLEKAARQALDALENLGWHGSERECDEAIKSLERALAQQAEPVVDDCTPNHLCAGRWVHKPDDEICSRCGHE